MPTQTQLRPPGVQFQEPVRTAPAGLRTGVPAFLGSVPGKDANRSVPLTLWRDAVLPADGYLASAVHGFFANGGQRCYLLPLSQGADRLAALSEGLAALEAQDDVDLVCAPELTRPSQGELDRIGVQRLQQAVLTHCDRMNDRLSLLDSLPQADSATVQKQRQGLMGTNGALYYPWLVTPGSDGLPARAVPPCGHAAGIYAQSDQAVGVHKAPANLSLEDAVSLEFDLTNAEQGDLNPLGINVLRAFPGRGLRIWGARTLAADVNWRYVNVRRVFLTLGRWIAQNLTSVTFEQNNTTLWARIDREVTAYLTDLHRRGALKGRLAQESFYVKCDLETNPREVRDAGEVVTEIGLAPAAPGEFVIVRIVHGDSGITLSGPTQPG